jgi:hypothetical protein
MRLVLILLLLAAALWRAALDWAATIGQGYAFRLTSIDAALADAWPERWAGIVEAAKANGRWDPIGATLTAVPLALVPALLAFLLWITRRRRAR